MGSGEVQFHTEFDTVREKAIAGLIEKRGDKVELLGIRSRIDAKVRRDGKLVELAEFKSYRKTPKDIQRLGDLHIRCKKIMFGLEQARELGVPLVFYLYFGDGSVYRLVVPFNPPWRVEVRGWSQPREGSKFDSELCYIVPAAEVLAVRVGTLPVPIFTPRGN